MNVKADITTSTHVTDINAVFIIAQAGSGVPVCFK